MIQYGPVVGWYRSSRCGSESSCVEVARIDADTVGVRDSKLPPSSPYLTFSRSAWNAFVAALKAGDDALV